MKKTLMIMLLAVGIFGFGFSQTQAESEWAQITLVNNTSVSVTLYVDGEFGCGPIFVKGGMCTTQVKAGTHRLTAKLDNGKTAASTSVTVDSGESYTWTIGEE